MPARLKSPTPLQHHVHEWRKHKKLTLQQVADAIGTNKGHLSNIENGRATLMPAVAEAIARLLQIDVDTLWNRVPGEAVDLEQDLMALFRGGDTAQRRTIVEMARIILAMNRGGDHE